MSNCRSWASSEFSQLSLGDVRLNNRMIDIAASMSNAPSLPLNQVSDDWKAVKASYRFFENIKVTSSKIIAPHIVNTVKRAKSYDFIYVVQDTSVIDFSRHQKTTGLGEIGG